MLLGLTQLLHDQPERDGAEAVDRVAEDLLRVYGLSAKEAHEVCIRLLPDLDDLSVGDTRDRPDVTVAPTASDAGQIAVGQ